MSWRKIAALIFFLLVGLVGYKGCTAFYGFVRERFAPRSICVVCNRIYSDSLKKRIKKFVLGYLISRSYADIDLYYLCKNLKDKFKVVRKILWNWRSWEEAVLTIEGVRPLFCINENFILGNKKRLFSSDLFSDVDKNSLRYLKMAQPPVKISSDVYEFLRKIPSSYWEKYSIDYRGRRNIELASKNEKIRFVVDQDSMFDRDKIDKAKKLHKDFICSSGPNLLKRMKRRCVVYDLRFSDRICAALIRI
jgi:hypothetical protein